MCRLNIVLFATIGAFVGCSDASAPRHPYYIPAGQLIHDFQRDVVHAPTGFSGRLTIRVELKHDRVVTFTLDEALDDLDKRFGYSLFANDVTAVEDGIRRRLSAIIGDDAIHDVRVTAIDPIPEADDTE